MRKNKAYLINCFVKHYYGKDGKMNPDTLADTLNINKKFELLFKHRKGAEGTAQILGLQNLCGKEHAKAFLQDLQVSHYRFTNERICKFFQAWKPFVNKDIKNRLQFLALVEGGTKLRSFIRDMRTKSVTDRTLEIDKILISYHEGDEGRYSTHDIEIRVEYENEERLQSLTAMPYWAVGYARRHISKEKINEASRYSTAIITINISGGKITTTLGQ